MRIIFITSVAAIFCFIKAIAQNDTIPDSKYYPAKGNIQNVALILLGGSEGGLPNYYDIEKLTSLGYSCLTLGYFQTKNTPDRLEMIPVEYFEKAIVDLKSKPELKNKKIVVWGGSKGGELALLLASKYKQINGVIAAVPSSVVFQGLGGNPVSSWSENGKSIPFVPFAPFDYSKIVNNQYVEVYKLSLEQTEYVSKAEIEVENINGPVLLLAGKADSMWTSDQMSQMVMKRLDSNKFPHWHKLFSYDNAGHTLNDSYMIGGTKEGNKNARIDSEKRTLDFLRMLSEINASQKN
ncbi:dienelactone hydrolase family protein [Panacibacter sp. DH6]|uniref:Dienelactone hydrolase family protein n=1 Tax=Panacibacter microcysteis TaxID=2793269 RepID=A0A931GV09_9BACT|nr:acyl-CoA thioester hydrolase/BAAT C-terminal domain-containing protein [Panacibacter microcysteis]MBG9377276.1 dienelactone hydrolase family protein [Panacibacter microcysteis]